MDYSIPSDDCGEVKCCDLEMPLLTPESLKPLFNRYLCNIGISQWDNLLVNNKIDEDTFKCLSSLCSKLVVTVHHRIWDVLVLSMSDYVQGNKTGCHKCHRVTEDDVKVSLGNSLFSCLGVDLEDESSDADKLLQLVAQEVARHVNCSLAVMRQPDYIPHAEDCTSPDTIMSMILLAAQILRRRHLAKSLSKNTKPTEESNTEEADMDQTRTVVEKGQQQETKPKRLCLFKKLKRFFRRNNKVAPACEADTSGCHGDLKGDGVHPPEKHSDELLDTEEPDFETMVEESNTEEPVIQVLAPVNQIPSDDCGEVQCCDLEMPLLTPESLKPLFNRYLCNIGISQWDNLLVNNKIDEDTFKCLSSLCSKLVVTVHHRIWDVLVLSMSDYVQGNQTGCHKCHRVTEDDVKASLGNSLFSCLGVDLEDESSDADKLLQLVAQEVARHVNCSLTVMRQPDYIPHAEDCTSPDTVMSMILLAAQILRRSHLAKSLSMNTKPTEESNTEEPDMESVLDFNTEEADMDQTRTVVEKGQQQETKPKHLCLFKKLKRFFRRNNKVAPACEADTSGCHGDLSGDGVHPPEKHSDELLDREEPDFETMVEEFSTEEPDMESMVDFNTEEPDIESVVDFNTEEPDMESVLDFNTEEPDMESMVDFNTEEPDIESVVEFNTEEPDMESMLDFNTEEPVIQVLAPVNQIPSDDCGEVQCSDLEMPLVTPESFNPLFNRNLCNIGISQWDALLKNEIDDDTFIRLSGICTHLLATLHNKILEVVVPSMSDYVKGNKTGCHKCHRVTEDEVQASLGNSLFSCLGLDSEDESEYSDELLRLVTQEVTRKVNCSLALMRQPDSNPDTVDCTSFEAIAYMTLLVAYILTSSHNIEDIEEPDFRAVVEKGQQQETKRKRLRLVKKLKRFFRRNNKVAPACEADTSGCHGDLKGDGVHPPEKHSDELLDTEEPDFETMVEEFSTEEPDMESVLEFNTEEPDLDQTRTVVEKGQQQETKRKRLRLVKKLKRFFRRNNKVAPLNQQ